VRPITEASSINEKLLFTLRCHNGEPWLIVTACRSLFVRGKTGHLFGDIPIHVGVGNDKAKKLP
jgi:hypothetical protein